MAALNEVLVGHRETMQSLFVAMQKGRLGSTLLFAGPAGVGKKLAALTLAQALVCEQQAVPGCGRCGPCLRIASGQSESLRMIAPDGVSIKTEQAREILEFLNLRQLGRARVIIVDQAHLMNPQAGNALLKSLEEPPVGTFFFLVTPAPAALLTTIRSRSQLVLFKPLSDGEVAQVIGPDADSWVIRSAHGSVERAQGLTEKREEFEKLESITNRYMKNAPQGLPSAEVLELRELTKDKALQVFVAAHLQKTLLEGLRVQAGLKFNEVSLMSEESMALVNRLAGFHPKALQTLADLSIELEQDLLRNVDRGLVLENFAIQWRAASLMPVNSIQVNGSL